MSSIASGIGAIGAVRAGRAYVEIGADDSALVAGLYKAAAKIQRFGLAIRGIGLSVFGAGASLFAPLAGAATAYANHGAALVASARKTGVAVESLSTLEYAAQQTKIEIEALDKGLLFMSRSLAVAAQGGAGAKGVIQNLRNIGVESSDLDKLNQEERFKKIAEGISKISEPAERAAAAMKIFGRAGSGGGAALLPLLEQGAAGIQAFQDRAKAMGLQWSSADAGAANRLYGSLKDLWDVFRRLTEYVGGAVAPVFERAANVLTHTGIAVGRLVNDHKKLFATVAIASAGLVVLGGALAIAGVGIQLVGVALGTVAAVGGAVAYVLAAMVSPVGLIVTALAAGAVALIHFTTVGATAANAITQFFKRIYDVVSFVFQNTSTMSEAWGAIMTEAGLAMMVGWANAKSFVVGLWIEAKYFAQSIWNAIGEEIIESAYGATDTFLRVWEKTLRAWHTAVSATAQVIQELFFETSDDALHADLDQINFQEQSGKITHEQAEKDRAAAHKSFDNYDKKQYEAADAAADAKLEKALSDISAEAAARQQYLEKLRLMRQQQAEAEKAVERAKNAAELADAKKTYEETTKAYEAELKKRHTASGAKSIFDQIKDLTAPLFGLNGKDPDNVPGFDFQGLGHAAMGSFAGSQRLISGMFNEGGESPAKETAKNTRAMKFTLDRMARSGGGLRVH